MCLARLLDGRHRLRARGPPLILVIVTREAGAYGVGALIPALVVCCAIVVMGISAALSIVDRLWRRTRPFPRTIAALAAFGAATVCLAPAVAELVGVAPPSVEGWLPTVAGVALLAIAAILAAGRSERLPALVFAAGWVLLLGIAGYSVWTEMEVDVAWLGPNSMEDGPGRIAFSATRPGNFEVRFGASSCSEGEVIATGRYDHQPGRPDRNSASWCGSNCRQRSFHSSAAISCVCAFATALQQRLVRGKSRWRRRSGSATDDPGTYHASMTRSIKIGDRVFVRRYQFSTRTSGSCSEATTSS